MCESRSWKANKRTCCHYRLGCAFKKVSVFHKCLLCASDSNEDKSKARSGIETQVSAEAEVTGDNTVVHRHTEMCTLEVSDTVSQLPPVRENFPDPIRSRISSGVSFGPLANGVYLKKKTLTACVFLL